MFLVCCSRLFCLIFVTKGQFFYSKILYIYVGLKIRNGGYTMSLPILKLEMLRAKAEEKISQIKSLGYQSVPIEDLTMRQITMFLVKNTPNY